MLFNAIVCQSMDIVKHGVSGEGKDRYKCRNVECKALHIYLEIYLPRSFARSQRKDYRYGNEW